VNVSNADGLDHGGLHPTPSEFRPVSDPDRARRTEVSNGRRALYDEKRHLRDEDLEEEEDA
jgi:hypothetical protein